MFKVYKDTAKVFIAFKRIVVAIAQQTHVYICGKINFAGILVEYESIGGDGPYDIVFVIIAYVERAGTRKIGV